MAPEAPWDSCTSENSGTVEGLQEDTRSALTLPTSGRRPTLSPRLGLFAVTIYGRSTTCRCPQYSFTRAARQATPGSERFSAPRTRRYRAIVRAYALLAPALALVLGVLAYPIGWEMWVSLTNCSSHLLCDRAVAVDCGGGRVSLRRSALLVRSVAGDAQRKRRGHRRELEGAPMCQINEQASAG